jgi:aminoglycoside phosphotransferase family enzyme/predicted kinase
MFRFGFAGLRARDISRTAARRASRQNGIDGPCDEGLTQVKARGAAWNSQDECLLEGQTADMPASVLPVTSNAEDDQAAIFAGLANALGEQTSLAVKRVDTQGAVVLLAGDAAYKIRRAIRLPFLDYSTLEKRRAASEAEVALNRESAPGIYLGAVPITRQEGRLAIGGDGEVLEWATQMRRFDENATLDKLAERGDLSSDLIARLARAIHALHERAPKREGEPAIRSLETYLDQNEAAFAAQPDLFDPARAAELNRLSREALAAQRPLLLSRGERGFVRRCHGDLHLRNIAAIKGEPVPFDAIEFDDSIATGDILYDLAFAIMDLWERDLSAAANRLLNGYLAEGEEENYSGLAALPFFLSLRAAIRAKVEAGNLSHLTGDAHEKARESARRYFQFALTFLQPASSRLVAIGGLSGTGKSALAAALAPELGRAPGVVWLRSDVERKHLFAVEETTRLPDAAYSEAAKRETYARLSRKASRALKAGQCAIVDAVCARASERQAISALASELGVDFAGLWLEAPLETRRGRVDHRAGDVSDADARVVAAQRADPLAEAGWIAIDASGDLDFTLLNARRQLGV